MSCGGNCKCSGNGEREVGLDKAFNDVEGFHKAFNHPVASEPTFMEEERAKARYSWMLEELDEFLGAETIVDQADALVDLIYFALGTFVEVGVKPQAIFDAVQKANMRKLHEDGKPRFRDDGKVIKPSGWYGPEGEIREIIERVTSDEDL